MRPWSEVFAFSWKAFKWQRGVGTVIIALVTVIVLAALDKDQYTTSVVFGLMYTAAIALGGAYGYVVKRMAAFALIGAVLTVLGFWIGVGPWGWVALSAFVITLAAGLSARFGAHGLSDALWLNSWYLIAIGMAAGYDAVDTPSPAWAQTLAWLAGAAVWIAYISVGWLAGGRKDLSQRVPDLPGDVSPMELTRPMILFAVIRALAIGIAVAIAFGLDLPEAQWMSLAAFVSMKPALDQTTLRAEQRFIGALIGAIVAALFLLTIADLHVLEVVSFVALGLSVIFFPVNYTTFAAAMAAGVLIAMGLPDPTNHAAEVERVLWTFAGVAVGVLITLLADVLGKRTVKPPQAAPRSA